MCGGGYGGREGACQKGNRGEAWQKGQPAQRHGLLGQAWGPHAICGELDHPSWQPLMALRGQEQSRLVLDVPKQFHYVVLLILSVVFS